MLSWCVSAHTEISEDTVKQILILEILVFAIHLVKLVVDLETMNVILAFPGEIYYRIPVV
jgi:hypothetical protein